MLRHDPDIMMVGEVRDFETAELAIRAALTGHLVLSTIHTNDAPSAITRLLDMGIEPFLLSSTLELVISQRLVRKICEHCKQKNKNTVKSKGCTECNNSGYKGRIGIFEILQIDEDIQQAIVNKKTAKEIKKIAEDSGFKDLYFNSQQKIKNSITNKAEILKVIN